MEKDQNINDNDQNNEVKEPISEDESKSEVKNTDKKIEITKNRKTNLA